MIGADRADKAFTDLVDLAPRIHGHWALLSRVWELRRAVSAYDATYLALAEAIAAPLVTCDGGLGRTTGHEAETELII